MDQPPAPVVVHMPEEVVFEILLRLPVVSLLRFKSICKSWLSLIGSSRFVTQHLLRQKEKDNIIALEPNDQWFHDPSDPTLKVSDVGLYSLTLSSDSDAEFERLVLPPVVVRDDSKPHVDQFWDLQLVGHCHGLICLYRYDDGGVFYLWNPSTKQCRSLPHPDPTWKKWRNVDDRRLVIGFGFDERSNDYKVVRFWPPENVYDHERIIDEIHIYSLNNNSWKVMEDVIMPNPLTDVLFTSVLKTPYQDGIFCWIAKDESRSRDDEQCTAILCFDFKTDALGMVELPDQVKTEIFVGRVHLVVTRGGEEKISCIHVVELEEEKDFLFEIWIMNEFGIKDSWTKSYKIGPFPFSSLPCQSPLFFWMIGFLKNGELLCLLLNGKLICWTPYTNRINSLLPMEHHDLSLIMYQETLLSPHPP